MPKLSTYPTATLTQGDQLPIVDDPSGTPSTKLITASHAFTNLQAGLGFDTPTLSGTPPTYEVQASDFGKVLIHNSANAGYFTVPAGLPNNFFFYVRQVGVGKAVIQGTGSSYVYGVASIGGTLTATGAVNSLIEVRCVSADSFICLGSSLAIPPYMNTYSVKIDNSSTTGHYVSFALLNSALSSSTAMSFAFWFKGNLAVADMVFAASLSWRLEYRGSSILRVAWPSGSPTSDYSGLTVNIGDGNWHHICCVQDATNFNIHIDGGSAAETGGTGASIVHTSAGSPGDFHSNFSLGTSFATREPTIGYYDELSFWDAILPDAAIVELAANGPIDPLTDFGNYNNSGDVVNSFRMGDGDTAPTILDLVGSGDATLEGTGDSTIVADVAT